MAAKGWMVSTYEMGGQQANEAGRVEVGREGETGLHRSGRRGRWGADVLWGERGRERNLDVHTTSKVERCDGGERRRKAVGEGPEMGVGWRREGRRMESFFQKSGFGLRAGRGGW